MYLPNGNIKQHKNQQFAIQACYSILTKGAKKAGNTGISTALRQGFSSARQRSKRRKCGQSGFFGEAGNVKHL